MIKIHNTLTRQKEIFTPIEENNVRMYVCGPTVYNYIHIGNARSTIAFDVIRRYFEYRGYEVNFVSNFTDVDDKIIKAAKELSITAPEVADRFIAAFEEAVYDEKKKNMDVRIDDGEMNVDSLDSTEYSTESVQEDILYIAA